MLLQMTTWMCGHSPLSTAFDRGPHAILTLYSALRSLLSIPLIPLELTNVTSRLLFSASPIKLGFLWTISLLCPAPIVSSLAPLPSPRYQTRLAAPLRMWQATALLGNHFFTSGLPEKGHLHLYTCVVADLYLSKAWLLAILDFPLIAPISKVTVFFLNQDFWLPLPGKFPAPAASAASTPGCYLPSGCFHLAQGMSQ